MIMTYKECIEKFGNAYQVNKVMEAGFVYKIEEGIYSDNEFESEVAVILKKYPKTVLTGDYAFYVHGLTNVVPDQYSLATEQKAAVISDKRVKQIYMRNDLLHLGEVEQIVDGAALRIYDKERMLIELLRNRNKMPYDLYKEIIYNYRKIITELEIWRIQEYAEIFPKSKMIKKALDEEVM